MQILIYELFRFAGTKPLSQKLTASILDECHKTFVSCYHAFYPTAYLKWTLLCELLSDIDKVSCKIHYTLRYKKCYVIDD